MKSREQKYKMNIKAKGGKGNVLIQVRFQLFGLQCSVTFYSRVTKFLDLSIFICPTFNEHKEWRTLRVQRDEDTHIFSHSLGKGISPL